MIKECKGDLLKSGCDIICHQVNLQGIMGGGLALQIATKYPNCEEQYKQICEKNNLFDLAGNVHFFCYNDEKTNLGKYIANCFSQNEDFTTNYKWLKECVERVKNFAKQFNCRTIGYPLGYGSGIAIGNKKIIEKIINSSFEKEQEIELQWWNYEK